VTYQPHPGEVSGHPTAELQSAEGGDPVVITVCAECGRMRTVLWLNGDRWFCINCRAEGAKPPNLYPVA